MPVALGLLAAAFYGAADFCGGLATRRSSMLAVTLISQAAGFVLLIAALPFFGGQPSLHALLYGLLAGCCGGAGIALLYHALSIGKMGVVSPITAVLAASLPVFVGAARGERLNAWQVAGIFIALGAVVLISRSTQDDGRFSFATAGVREAIACGVILGGFYIFLGLAGHAGLYPLIGARAGSTLCLAILAFATRATLVPPRDTLAVILLAGILDVTANGLYLFATYGGYLSIAAVLTSLYPASTVLLARVVLRERLATLQKIGVGLALAGVALIAR